MDLFLIHGNHLFPINYLNKYKKDNIFVLIENYKFCTNKKYHKNLKGESTYKYSVKSDLSLFHL